MKNKRLLETQETQVMSLYRHFKGKWYNAIDEAIDTVTDSVVVIYESTEGKLFTRPKEEFLGPVDLEKYPNASQSMRMMNVPDLIAEKGNEEAARLFRVEYLGTKEDSTDDNL